MSAVEQVGAGFEVQCTRCRNRHMESERLAVRGDGLNYLVCPRCSCKSFYDLRPQVAWCWASGLIEFGGENDVPEDSIVIAHGPKAFLIGVISALSRHGRGASIGKFLVPGIPEAPNQQVAGDALAIWLAKCARVSGPKGRNGVVFKTENVED